MGRWFSVDPVFQPWQSPYTSMDNNPVNLTDVLGLKPGDNKAFDNTEHGSVTGEEVKGNNICRTYEDGTKTKQSFIVGQGGRKLGDEKVIGDGFPNSGNTSAGDEASSPDEQKYEQITTKLKELNVLPSEGFDDLDMSPVETEENHDQESDESLAMLDKLTDLGNGFMALGYVVGISEGASKLQDINLPDLKKVVVTAKYSDWVQAGGDVNKLKKPLTTMSELTKADEKRLLKLIKTGSKSNSPLLLKGVKFGSGAMTVAGVAIAFYQYSADEHYGEGFELLGEYSDEGELIGDLAATGVSVFFPVGTLASTYYTFVIKPLIKTTNEEKAENYGNWGNGWHDGTKHDTKTCPSCKLKKY